jgi:hypothetical protein
LHVAARNSSDDVVSYFIGQNSEALLKPTHGGLLPAHIAAKQRSPLPRRVESKVPSSEIQERMASVAHCRSDKAATSARPISCRSVSAFPGSTVKRRFAPPSCCLSARLERGGAIARGDESRCAQDQDYRGKASIARGSAELVSGSRPGRRGNEPRSPWAKVGLWVASVASCGSFQRVAGCRLRPHGNACAGAPLAQPNIRMRKGDTSCKSSRFYSSWSCSFGTRSLTLCHPRALRSFSIVHRYERQAWWWADVLPNVRSFEWIGWSSLGQFPR